MSGRLMTRSMRFPSHMLAMTPQKRLGFRVITSGPGTMPWMVIAPTISAITALGGIPSVRRGMNEVCAPALFADSGRPRPRSRRGRSGAGPGELLLQRVGGERPEHRAVAGEDSQRPPEERAADDRQRRLPEVRAGRAAAGRWRRAPRRGPASTVRLRITSAKPNRPIASTAKSRPSDSEATPNVIRSTPVSRSCPTVESSSPSRTMAMDLRIEPRASTTAKASPAVISAAVLRRPEEQRHPGERHGQRGDDQRRDAAGEERAERGDAQRRAGAALLAPSGDRRAW